MNAKDEVYPRPRGEYASPKAVANSCYGLPPPTRGIRIRRPYQGIQRRSTPAHAGNTIGDGRDDCRREVYPRPRGEYEEAARADLRRLGLPPPTRGIRPHTTIVSAISGSTPAHAGNTDCQPVSAPP